MPDEIGESLGLQRIDDEEATGDPGPLHSSGERPDRTPIEAN